MRFFRNAEIDNIAEQRIAQYERQFGAISIPPVPIEKVIGQVYGLIVLWETIEEMPGETILGAIQPREHIIG